MRIFYHHKLLKKTNINKFQRKLSEYCDKYDKKKADYDEIYDLIEGWIAYTEKINTHNLQTRILAPIYDKFAGEISTKEYNRHLKEEKSHHFIVSQNCEYKDNI